MNADACADHGNIYRAKGGLDGAFGADALAPHRKAHGGELFHVTYTGVDDQCFCTARHERSSQQVAEKTVAIVSREGCDDDVARLDLLGHDVHHPVVARVQQYGNRGARHQRTAVDRAHVGLHEANPAHRLVHGGHAEAAEFVDGRPVGAVDVALNDAKLCHVCFLKN